MWFETQESWRAMGVLFVGGDWVEDHRRCRGPGRDRSAAGQGQQAFCVLTSTPGARAPHVEDGR